MRSYSRNPHVKANSVVNGGMLVFAQTGMPRGKDRRCGA